MLARFGLFGVALLLSSAAARADAWQRKLSPYEQETVQLVLADTGAVLETEPEGKRLEGIDVVPLDVFEPRDPAPQFLNWFHVTTQQSIIEREVLLEPGAPFDPALAAESERNLRAFSQFSLVVLVPVRGSEPDSVRVLVITKDVWSLRVSWDPNLVNGKLTSLSLAPAETNLFGTTQTVLASLYLDPNNYWVGGRYSVPRIAGSRIRASVGGNAIFNCRSNEIEGATGDFTYGQPLYSSLARWSWQTAMTWSSSVVRGLTTNEERPICAGAEPAVLRYPGSPAETTGDVGSRVVEQDQLVFPSEYRAERLRGQVVLTRSYFLEDKVNLSTGMEVDSRAYVRDSVPIDAVVRERVRYEEQPNGTFLRTGATRLPPDRMQYDAAQRVYLDPRSLRPSDRRISPYGQVHAFSNRYVRVINYNTLGLQEDVQVGHDVYLRLYPGFEPLSTRNLFGVFASAAYTTYGRAGLGRALASTDIEYGGPRESDVTVRAATHYVTPDVGIGRFVYDLGFYYQPVQYLSGVYVLGGTGRLRGYKPAHLFGTGMTTFNHEFRSRPLRAFSVLAGLALFHDVGSVFDERFEGFRLRQGAGFGLRILAPQLDRDVFRIDFGFPLVFPESDDPAARFTFTASFRQAFSTPVAFPSALLPQ